LIAIFLLAITAIVAVGAFLIFKTTKRNEPALVGIAAALLFTFFLAIFGHTFVKNQHVGYTKVFGVVQQGRTIQPGFQLKAPWEEVKQVDTSVGTMTFSGAKGGYALLEGLTSDGILIRVDLATSWAVVPSCVPAFKTVFGVDGRYEDQVYSIIRSAARDVLAETSWKSGAILNRDLFTTALQNKIELKTKQFFAEAGLPNCAVVRYGAVNLRKIVPPAKIQESNNDLAVADNQLLLQNKLKLVEESRKAVREAQAANYNALVRVPAGMDPKAYAAVLSATTEQMNAETVRDALENGRSINVVVGMGVAPQPTVSAK